MAKEEQVSTNLPERPQSERPLAEQLKDIADQLIGRLRDALAELTQPAPEPVLIPVRSRYRR